MSNPTLILLSAQPIPVEKIGELLGITFTELDPGEIYVSDVSGPFCERMFQSKLGFIDVKVETEPSYGMRSALDYLGGADPGPPTLDEMHRWRVAIRFECGYAWAQVRLPLVLQAAQWLNKEFPGVYLCTRDVGGAEFYQTTARLRESERRQGYRPAGLGASPLSTLLLDEGDTEYWSRYPLPFGIYDVRLAKLEQPDDDNAAWSAEEVISLFE